MSDTHFQELDMDGRAPLLHAQQEVVHLKETISTLRDVLETKDFEKDVAIQKTVQASFDEILNLPLDYIHKT